MLEGDISQIDLIARCVELWREQFTGAIRFENDGIIKIIYFKGGDVLSASTNDRADSIDEILMRAGKVSRDHVKQALARRKESETLGDAMLNLGYITRKELTWARRVQVVGVIRSIAAWTSGSFTIVADYLPKRDEGTLFPLPQIVVELIVTEQDRQKFERALDGGTAVFEKTTDFDEVFGRLGLNEDAEAIIAQVDGTRSATEVAAISGRDAFNVYKLLHALATLGILQRLEKPRVMPQLSLDEDFATAGVGDAADIWGDDTATVTPTFELDDTEAAQQATLELGPTFDGDETKALASPLPPRSAWDEPDEEEIAPAGAATEVAKMPAWDAPPPAAAAPIPAPVPPPAEPAEEQWGFDEAQIETAQRAAAPPPIPPPVQGMRPPAAARPAGKKPKAGRGAGFLVALLVIAVLAGAAYGGFVWWQNQQERATETAAVEPRPAAAPTTMVPTPATAPPTTTAAPVATTTPVPDVGRPSGRPAPAEATPDAAQPLPAVTPRGSGSRIDELARGYAANPQGSFTVQIQILCDPANVEKAIRAGGDNVWFVPQTIGARACYRVFWGRFGTREEAQRAMATVPAALRDPNAAVRPVPRPQ